MSDRPCTCHPDDNPPVPCPQKYALSECRAAAPAPEPWAWGWEDVTRDGREIRCATPDLTLVPSYVTDKGLIPLYAHPAPAAPAPDEYNRKLRRQLEQEWVDVHALKRATAAPAPAADEIMALADEWAMESADDAIEGGEELQMGSETRSALRAAVEQLVRERDAAVALAEMRSNYAAHKRAERAERERDELRALLNACRLYVETSSMDGRELLARIDAALKEGKCS